MAPCCSKTDHGPAKSTAATITVSLPFQWFISAVPSGRQMEPKYFEIWQPALRLQYNSGFNILLRGTAVLAELPGPSRSASPVTAHSLALCFPSHLAVQQAGK